MQSIESASDLPVDLNRMRVLRIKQAAEIAGVSVDTLHRLGEAGKIRITKLSPRRKGIRVDHLAEYLEARSA